MVNQQSNNAGLILAIGIISVVALILAWMAYNRAGTDLSTQIEQGTEEVAVETEQAFETAVNRTDAALARAEARADLIALRAELAAEQNYAEAVAEVQMVRTNLRNAYQNAEVTVQAEWRELDRELEQLEQSLRENSADSLETLSGLILLLEQDVRTDEQ